jgi:hypothetical protein
MVNHVAVCVAVLTAFGVSIVAQSRIDPVDSELSQERAPVAPHSTPHPRLEVASGIALVTIRKLPADSRVGGSPVGIFVSAGYLWTRYLVTQIEVVFQVEDWKVDYASEQVLGLASVGTGLSDLTTVSLQRHYEGGRRSLAQIVQTGTRRFQPYVGVGVGLETDTIREGRQEYTRPLLPGEVPPPGAKTRGTLPTEFSRPTDTHHVIAFAQAGLKVSVTRRAHVLIDWKFTQTGPPRITLGLGLELF